MRSPLSEGNRLKEKRETEKSKAEAKRRGGKADGQGDCCNKRLRGFVKPRSLLAVIDSDYFAFAREAFAFSTTFAAVKPNFSKS